MKIYIKTNRNKAFCIPVPSSLAKVVLRPSLGDFVKRKVMEQTDKESRKYMEYLDFKALFGSISDLFNYKGLKLVEVLDKQGNEITIVI